MDTTKKTGAAVQNGTANNNTANPAKANAAKGDNAGTPNEQKADQHIGTPPAIEQEPAKVVALIRTPMNIEERLKALELLQVRKNQYENLLDRIKDLNDFEFDLMENADELQSNHFAGCKLIIMDGKGTQFNTHTANLIQQVADFLKSKCLEKKAELEDLIVFPAA